MNPRIAALLRSLLAVREGVNPATLRMKGSMGRAAAKKIPLQGTHAGMSWRGDVGAPPPGYPPPQMLAEYGPEYNWSSAETGAPRGRFPIPSESPALSDWLTQIIRQMYAPRQKP